MRRKKAILAVSIAAVYCLLLYLLVSAESSYTSASYEGASEETITTFPKALWYSLTTLTTVGYGDLYPHSVAGKIIGSVFMLLSVGALAFLISILLSVIRNRIFPKMRLRFSKDKDWFIFSEYNNESAEMARNLRQKSDNCLLIFPSKGSSDSVKPFAGGINTDFSVEELVKLKSRRGNISVFYIGGNEYRNYHKALLTEQTTVYAMTEYEPDILTDRLKFFHPCQCCARLYWRRFPVLNSAETIALIGDGRYAAALLDQALTLNVFSPDQHLTYLVYGTWKDYSENHPFLSDIFSVAGPDPLRDSLLFVSEQWSKDRERLAGADRIIVCFDSEEKNMDTLSRLKRYFPVSGTVYARLSCPFENVITFGGAEEVFTPELVIRAELEKTAIALNEIYRRNTGGTAPSWNELSGFLRRSNMASADHLDVKAQILLGPDCHIETAKERYARAYQVYLDQKDQKAEFFRKVEHDRWMRFHILNNWHYAPHRDNARRLHPMLVPYEQLPVEEQMKDDYAWELLGNLSKADF